MTIDKGTAIALADLYHRREGLQRTREKAMSRDLWIGFVDRGQAPLQKTQEPTRSFTECEQIVDALGGAGSVATLLMQSTLDLFQKMQTDIDQQISELGGQP